MGRIGMPEEIYQQRRAFFGTAAMAVATPRLSWTLLQVDRRKRGQVRSPAFGPAATGASAPKLMVRR